MTSAPAGRLSRSRVVTSLAQGFQVGSAPDVVDDDQQPALLEQFDEALCRHVHDAGRRARPFEHAQQIGPRTEVDADDAVAEGLLHSKRPIAAGGGFLSERPVSLGTRPSPTPPGKSEMATAVVRRSRMPVDDLDNFGTERLHPMGHGLTLPTLC